MKKFKFALTDNTSYSGKDALEFYSKALLEGGSKSTFRVIPGIKSTANLPSYNAGNIIQDAGCSWTPSGEGTLSQKRVSVDAKDIQLELCTTTFENNFLGELLKPGHNTGEVSPTVFIDYMLEQVAKKVQNDLEIAVWQGDTSSQSYPEKITDGLLKKFDASADIIEVSNTVGVLTVGNIIAEMSKVYDSIPAAVLKDADLKIYVSNTVYKLYQQAVAAASNEAYYVGAKEPNFLGIPLIWSQGMPDDTIVAASSNNLVLLTDLLSDEEELNVIPQAGISGVRTVRIAGGFKVGVDFLNADEIVVYIASGSNSPGI